MSKNLYIDYELMEGRTYIVGREGHIYIDSIFVSKQHAEIKIMNGRIYLRDLGSTNGTYLLKNNSLVYFEEGFVNPFQPIVIGNQKHTIQSLLAIVNSFVATDDTPTQANFANRTVNSRG